MTGIKENFSKIFFSLRFAEFLVLGLVFLFCIRSISDFDIWYHLKAGEYNFTNRAILRHDIFSFSVPGAEWISHSWLAEIIFYFVYSYAGGMWGLIFFSALMAVLTYFIVLRTVELRRALSFFSVLLVLPMGYLTFELFVPRPQIFSYVFLVLLIYFLERWRRQENSKIFFLIPVLMFFWANMHASAILGFLVIAAYVASVGAAYFFKNGFSGISEKIKAPLFISFASFIILFINPSGYKAPAYFFIVAPWNKVWNIAEWFSLRYFLHILQARVFILLMAVSILAYLIFEVRKNRQGRKLDLGQDLFDWILILAVFTLPWLSIRHVAYFSIVTLPLIAQIFSDFPKILARLKIKGSHFVFGAIVFIFLIYFFAFNNLPAEPVNAKIIPVKAVDFMEEQKINGPIFNHPRDGGYLIWRLWPRERVLTDGRVDVYRGEMAYDYLRIAIGQTRDENDPFHQYGDNLIDKYGFNVFFMSYLLGNEERKEVIKNLSLHLMTRHNFRLIFWNSASLILIRNSPENQDLIRRLEYRIVSPFVNPTDIPDNFLGEAQKEIERAIQFSPADDFLRWYKLELFRFPF